MIDLHKLRHFVSLTRAGSFAAAADELHLSQPSLTRSIQSLEASLGVKLIDRRRGRSGIELTPSGVELVGRATALLRDAGAIRRAISPDAVAERRPVGFGLGPMLASALLPGVTGCLIDAHPDWATTIVVDDSDAMSARLLAGEIEFYIGLASPTRTSARIRSQVFGRVMPRFFVRPGHPLASAEHVGADELVAFPLLAGTAWRESHISLGQSVDPRLFQAAVLHDNYTLLVQIALTTDAIVVSGLRPGGAALVPLPYHLDALRSSTEMQLFSLKGLPFSPEAAEIIDRLSQSFEEQAALSGS